jgi:NAD-dependent deacetylase
VTEDATAAAPSLGAQRAAELIDEAQDVVVLTGAGISTDSGIPDFRGPNGIWTKDPDAEKQADIRYYVADPEIRRRSWQRRLEWATRARGLEPNPGHRAIVDLEQAGRIHTLVTQNIDGLHHAAGSDPELIVEVHGTMREVVCLGCDERGPVESTLDRVRAGAEDPSCLSCGGLLKSATVSFGQSLHQADLDRADRAARECDLLLVVGSSLGVHPICEMVPLARGCGADVVIVNGETTAYDDLADVIVRGSISDVLPVILAAG